MGARSVISHYDMETMMLGPGCRFRMADADPHG